MFENVMLNFSDCHRCYLLVWPFLSLACHWFSFLSDLGTTIGLPSVDGCWYGCQGFYGYDLFIFSCRMTIDK